jgi:hypothetical protein
MPSSRSKVAAPEASLKLPTAPEAGQARKAHAEVRQNAHVGALLQVTNSTFTP